MKKSNGTYRLVQDLQTVNGMAKCIQPVAANPYTLLNKLCDDLIWFLVIDFNDTFFHLPLAEESQNIFSFEWENPSRGRKKPIYLDGVTLGSQKQSHDFWESIGQRIGTMAVSA